MGFRYIINKLKLLDLLKFPKRQNHTDYVSYICNDRVWFIFGERNVFHSYKNKPHIKFGLLYVDTEDINEYYYLYPKSKFNLKN